eukprot:CAMPEP_0175535718 /NCGR_PEP_ID=MMETSP0096-20121207/24341_1 /TAXON_ID=311494 /ORGANISM="Alexandrium monilatum, Strain CCMP3105" /LENGTH=228 /DNA_ID=CAMNT_0016838519 /DNA_START=35 /DNA_END=721 /DNA_ORIENTATION=+
MAAAAMPGGVAVGAGALGAAAAACSGPGMPAVVPPPPPGMPNLVPPPGVPAVAPIPDAEDEALPFEHDSESWLELLRDGYVRQLREENEYPEPPPFHRAIHFAANPGEPIPPGKYPRQALNMQLQLLLRARAVDGHLPVPPPPSQKGMRPQLNPWIPVKGGGAKGSLVLPQLLLQMQQGGQQHGQFILEAAKALAAGKAVGNLGKGKGKGYGLGKGVWNGGVQRTIGK